MIPVEDEKESFTKKPKPSIDAKDSTANIGFEGNLWPPPTSHATTWTPRNIGTSSSGSSFSNTSHA
jgi:hypothetical protein